jgi:hypothetical protein
MMSQIERQTWEDFRASKLLWWINRILHTFGWAIVCTVESDGKVSDVYPAKVTFRGFDYEDESDGFKGVTEHLKENMGKLIEDTKD